jgi:hypothetical protein
VRAIGGRKEACRKRRKNNIHEEEKRGAHANMPNYGRVRVFVKDCNGYKPVK